MQVLFKGKVTKRDGTKTTFDEKRISTAVRCAADRTNEKVDIEHITYLVCKSLAKECQDHPHDLDVEHIQDVVVSTLLASEYHKTAEQYISYRKERDIAREQKSVLFSDIDNFVKGTDDKYIKENANKSAEELVCHRDLIAGIVSKHIASTTLPEEIRELNRLGAIHTHDLDYFISTGMHNCGVYDFDYMLAHGVKLGDVDIESPKSIQTAANVSCQIFSKISGSSYGGQSMHEFDKVLKPYAERTLEKLHRNQEKFGLSEDYVQYRLRKDIYDACQTFIYQIQTVTSANGQSAFTSISLSLSTDPICKMIKEEYLKCHMNGIGANHRTPIFPKVLYFVEDGVNLNKGDPNYDEFRLAMKCSSKQMYPDFIMAPNNRKMTGGSESVITPMG